MLHRIKKHKKSMVFLLLIFIFYAQSVQARENDKNIFISFFQEHISPADGDRCIMYPSCSSYAAAAIKQHGSLMGWIMACDRLVRCGRDECRISSSIVIDKEKYTFDPVQANDFWWFDSTGKTKP